MFRRIGNVVVRHPIWTIVAWLIATVAIVATAPALPSTSDESDFIPSSYESIQAAILQENEFPNAFAPSATVLFQRADGGKLTTADQRDAARITTGLGGKKIDQVQNIVLGEPSKDGRFTMALVQMNQETAGTLDQDAAAEALREDGRELAAGTDLDVKVGGPAAETLDQRESADRGETLIGLGTFGIILLTMLLIFRAPILAVLPLVMIGLVAGVANGVIANVTKMFDLQANTSLSSILIVVLFGVGTDYFLFLIFRYREHLRAGEEAKEAMVNAVARVGEAIASAAGAVIIAFLALLLSTVGFLRQMGPALAIAVVVTLIAGLTLMPAVVSLIGPKVFWPSKSWRREPSGTRFTAFGRGVQRRPVVVAAVSGFVLVALSVGSLNYSATFDLAAGATPESKESMVVQKQVTEAYSIGASSPTEVYVSSSDGRPLDKSGFDGYAAELRGVDGVASADLTQMNDEGTTAKFTITLRYEASSTEAIDVVGDVRDASHASAPEGTEVLVGGLSAIYKDIDHAVGRDYRTVFPVAAALIMVILGLMLRSIVAPWYLMASVGLGFGATLGTTVWVFQGAQGRPGLMFMLPVIMYLFVVAIGTDYNILMIARLREESRAGRDPRAAAGLALRHAGPAVATAGFILAATFSTMMLAGNTLLTQMGFALSFGIAITAFVMALFFTPAITALIGHTAWWPGHGDRRKSAAEPEFESNRPRLAPDPTSRPG